MIPRYSINVNSDLPADATFWVPGAQELEDMDQLGDFHNVWLIETDLQEADAVIAAERTAVDYVDRNSRTGMEFDELSDQIEFEQPDCPRDEAPAFFSSSDAWSGVEGLELGVAGLCYALNAVGVLAAASCRGHAAAHRKWSDYPVVFCAIGERHARVLQRLAEDTGCGFEVALDRGQFLVVYAESIIEMMTLAQKVIDSAAGFKLSPAGDPA